jgi:hypothetical protein
MRAPTRRASAMNDWNMRRFTHEASSIRIVTCVSRPSSTRGGAK